jgi:hypothetical protein
MKNRGDPCECPSGKADLKNLGAVNEDMFITTISTTYPLGSAKPPSPVDKLPSVIDINASTITSSYSSHDNIKITVRSGTVGINDNNTGTLVRTDNDHAYTVLPGDMEIHVDNGALNLEGVINFTIRNDSKNHWNIVNVYLNSGEIFSNGPIRFTNTTNVTYRIKARAQKIQFISCAFVNKNTTIIPTVAELIMINSGDAPAGVASFAGIKTRDLRNLKSTDTGDMSSTSSYVPDRIIVDATALNAWGTILNVNTTAKELMITGSLDACGNSMNDASINITSESISGSSINCAIDTLDLTGTHGNMPPNFMKGQMFKNIDMSGVTYDTIGAGALSFFDCHNNYGYATYDCQSKHK